jgi:hypothetical protein
LRYLQAVERDHSFYITPSGLRRFFVAVIYSDAIPSGLARDDNFKPERLK